MRAWPMLKMVTLNHIKHKPVRSNTSPLIQKMESIHTWKTKDEDYEEAEDCNTSGVLTAMALILLLASAELAETLPPVDFLPPRWVSVPLSKLGLLAKEAPLHPGTGLFCTVKWNADCGLALPCLIEGKDWDKFIEDCLLSLHQRPVYTAILASLTRRNNIL